MSRLAWQGWPWGYDPAGGTLVAGRGESFAKTESGQLLSATPAPASGDIRCFRGYFKLTGAIAGDYRDFAYTTDWDIYLDADGKLALSYTPTGAGSSTSGVHTDIPRVDCPMDGGWHALEVGQRFGPDGYFGVRIDGVLVHDDPEFDYDPATGGADRSYSFYAPDTDLTWTDLALNDDTWVGPGKTVLAKPSGGSDTGNWTGATSWANTFGTGPTTVDIPGGFDGDCRRGDEYREFYHALHAFAATNLAHVPPAPQADYSGDGTLPGGDFHSGAGFMVSSPGSQGYLRETWRPATAAESHSAPGDKCYGHEWIQIEEHRYYAHGVAAPGDDFDVDIDASAVTGDVGWAEPQALIAEGATVLGAGTTETEEYVTLRKPGDAAPAIGAPNRMRIRDHLTGGSTPTSYQLLRIPNAAGAIPTSLTVERHVGGDQVVNCCAAGVAIDCDNTPQPPLPEHDDGMWIA